MDSALQVRHHGLENDCGGSINKRVDYNKINMSTYREIKGRGKRKYQTVHLFV
jgi:hypothetical protein